MALYKQIEFAALCGMSTGNLSTYKNRKKIMLTDDGMVDTAVPMNAEFLKKWQEKNATKTQPPTPPPVKEQSKKKTLYDSGPDEIPFEHVIEPEKRIRKNKDADHVATLHTLEKQQKGLQLEKTQVETELLRQKIKKMEGETIPTALVITAFSQHFKSVNSSFKNFINKFLIELAKKKGLSRTEVAEMRGKMVQHLNASIQESIVESKKSIAAIVAEHSNKKEVGERE